MVTNKYSKLMSLETESAASALPIRTYEIDVDFSMYPTTPKKTDIIYINGDTNSSIIKARLLMGVKPVNLFGKMVVMNVREGMGHDNLSILGEVIDIDKWLNKLGDYLESKFKSKKGNNISCPKIKLSLIKLTKLKAK